MIDGDKAQVVLVTGMSGAGKTSALKAFEDLHFEAIDHVPLSLLEHLVGAGQGQMQKLQLNAIFSDFLTELFTRISPFTKKSAYTTTSCQGYYMEMEDGLPSEGQWLTRLETFIQML